MSAPPRRSSRMDSSPTNEDVTEILPNLFLGSHVGAQNLTLLRQRGITHILSVMVDPTLRESEEATDDFRRMRIPVQDWPDTELLTYFHAANSFINAARLTAEEGVLVHCYQGVSRSATIVAAYLMATHPPLHDDTAALAFLRERRPIVQPNSGFLSQLALYGRCNCDLEAYPTAVEAWRAGQVRKWEGRVDRVKREQGGRGSGKRWKNLELDWGACNVM
ncbi:protein-tyrosine phosphatase-like protein [Mycena galopus ATCC 62051]|nr:protein-tyrosine phosphatase-like protein [Mycena galopus ATCC 62051]